MNGRCKELGGYLVEIEDYSEYQFVRYLVNFVYDRGPFFIGLTDEQHEGHFLNYNDKTPAKYLRWRWFQPDNWYGEDCVEIGYRGFNDIGCEKWGRYVCEVPN
ncbi:collectin-12 [Plakobranchus ocellatus]|uniref:Collectin-12 n=1 Tax=Plakobranchus ocellatus TaxID=259542 RepID=A0AAV4CA65_9GAST|nr:collectin-12 [Plakobranchus ocellatus]